MNGTVRGGTHGAPMNDDHLFQPADRSPPASAAPRRGRPCPASLLTAFQREWSVMRFRSPHIARARSWGVTERSFADLDELLACAGYCRPSTAESDEVLRRLVAAARDDDLAARVVLQRVLPGLAAIARRRRFYGDEEALEEILGAAWIGIRTYRFEARRTHVAVNLIRDAAYVAFVGPRRRLSASEASIDPFAIDDRPAGPDESPCAELARVLDDAARNGVPASDVELVRDLARSGSEAVAAKLEVTARTVRNRRDRATAAIRRFATAA